MAKDSDKTVLPYYFKMKKNHLNTFINDHVSWQKNKNKIMQSVS